MSFGANLERTILSIALAAAAALFVVTMQPATATAGTKSCARYGKMTAKELSVHRARAAIRCLLNVERSSRGLSKLANDRRLQRAAQQHTQVMMDQNCFSHHCPGELPLEARLGAVNYLIGGLLRWRYAENIAYGGRRYSTPKSIVRSLMKSEGHRENILNPSLRDLGVGFVVGAAADPTYNGGLYTLDFGMRIK